MPAYMSISHLGYEMPKQGLLPSTIPGVQPGTEKSLRKGMIKRQMSVKIKLSPVPLATVDVLPFYFCSQRYLESSFAFGLAPEKQSFCKAAPTNAFSCQVFFAIDTKSPCKETTPSTS